jgi:hypothetical protein
MVLIDTGVRAMDDSPMRMAQTTSGRRKSKDAEKAMRSTSSDHAVSFGDVEEAPRAPFLGITARTAVSGVTFGLFVAIGVFTITNRMNPAAAPRAHGSVGVRSLTEDDDDERRLMKGTDNRNDNKCFEDKNERNYFDRNPWISDKVEKSQFGRRGNWAKCLPSPTFAVMCIHRSYHGYNPDPLNNSYKPVPSTTKTTKWWRGQMHDLHAGILYESLLKLHDEHCAYIDLQLEESAKTALDNYIAGTGEYAEPEPEPEPEKSKALKAEPEPEPEAEPEAEPEPESERKGGGGAWPQWAKDLTTNFQNCTKYTETSDYMKIGDKGERLRQSLYCAMATVQDHEDEEAYEAGQTACKAIYGLNTLRVGEQLPDPGRRMPLCPEDGGRACGVDLEEFGEGPTGADSEEGRRRRRGTTGDTGGRRRSWRRRRRGRARNGQGRAHDPSCDTFCTRQGLVCKSAQITMRGKCGQSRTWSCNKARGAESWLPSWHKLKCVCELKAGEGAEADSNVRAHPLSLDSPVDDPDDDDDGDEDARTCPAYKRIELRISVNKHSTVEVVKHEAFDWTKHDFNDIGNHEFCDGKELVPPTSTHSCSLGSRMDGDDANNPCLYRIEQRTYDEAAQQCASRGGRLHAPRSVAALNKLREFVKSNAMLGIGIRDEGAEDYFFDGTRESAKDVVEQIASAQKEGGWTRDDFKWASCMRTERWNQRRRKRLMQRVDCNAKTDWICEGTLQNVGKNGIVAEKDLLADEGAFCLWHVREPVDWLPNDEGKNFKNTDLACSKQVSSREKTRCRYDPENNKLLKERGDRDNRKNYPIKGAAVGWKGNASKATFLSIDASDDFFHCHYCTTNECLLRLYAFQHMFERNYAGSLKRTCGCGYKHLANLVSRCDCTRSGKKSNNCPKWQRHILGNRTKDSPVKCNNCNADDKL